MLKWHDLNLTKIADTDGNTATDNDGNPYFRAGNIPINNGSYVWTQDSRMLGHRRDNVGGGVFYSQIIPLMCAPEETGYAQCTEIKACNMNSVRKICDINSVNMPNGYYDKTYNTSALVVGKKAIWVTNIWNSNNNYFHMEGAPIVAKNLTTGKTITITIPNTKLSNYYNIQSLDMRVADNGDLLSAIRIKTDDNWEPVTYLFRNGNVYYKSKEPNSLLTNGWAFLRSDGTARILQGERSESGSTTTSYDSLPNYKSDDDLYVYYFNDPKSQIIRKWYGSYFYPSKVSDDGEFTSVRQALNGCALSIDDIVIENDHIVNESTEKKYIYDTQNGKKEQVAYIYTKLGTIMPSLVPKDKNSPYSISFEYNENAGGIKYSSPGACLLLITSSDENGYNYAYGVKIPEKDWKDLAERLWSKNGVGSASERHGYGIVKIEIGEDTAGKPVYADLDTEKYVWQNTDKGRNYNDLTFFGIEGNLEYGQMVATRKGKTSICCTSDGLFRISPGGEVKKLDSGSRSYYNYRLTHISNYGILKKAKNISIS